MAKEKRINIEYLTSKGFIPFKEEDNVISYHRSKDGLIVAFEHHNQATHHIEICTDWWILMIKGTNLLLQCECNTMVKYEQIMEAFGLKA